ncbi:hypothetical protein JCM11491_001468 [Sporobolomyces phaffii]
MPTISDDFSDPEDVLLDDSLAAPPSSASSSRSPRADVPLAAAGVGPDGRPVIPRAVRIGPLGQLYKVEQDEFKSWDAIYPIYVDTKHAQQGGARRVSKAVGLEWPLADQMAKACTMLGFETIYEPSKTHPRDWANPGRIRARLHRDDGTLTVASIPTKRVLLRRICDALRPHQPRAVPPSTLPPIELRLPPNSPAVSLGTLDQALEGGGPLGMLGNMFGGGGGGGAGGDAAAGQIEGDGGTTTPKKKDGPKVVKPRKVHMKRR